MMGVDDLPRLLYEACSRERPRITGITGWDRREGSEEYAGSTWQTVTTGLTEAEKEKWRRVAAMVRAAIQ